jgi:hypothetical protein
MHNHYQNTRGGLKGKGLSASTANPAATSAAARRHHRRFHAYDPLLNTNAFVCTDIELIAVWRNGGYNVATGIQQKN